MITIIDGMPGAGKTQFTISMLLKKAKKEKRPVYYNNIPELKIDDWQDLTNPDLWDEVPDGAIIVLDEAQRVFKLRPAGSEKPQRTVALETHRHKGHDLYLITQDGTLLDIQCRKLCNSFYHLKRIAGTKRVSVTEYAEFVNHNDYHERKKAIGSTVYKQEKKIWALYKSATIHTVKAKIPLKVLALPVIAFIAIGALYSAYTRWTGESPHVALAKERSSAEMPGYSPGTELEVVNLTPIQIEVREKANYFAKHKPRIRNKPETAPLYDSLRTVNSYPRLQCISSELNGCACYSQQGTREKVTDDYCRSFIANGDIFDPSIPDNAFTLANTLKDDLEPEWTNPDVGSITDADQSTVLILDKRYLKTEPIKYAKHDRGSMQIERVVSTK